MVEDKILEYLDGSLSDRESAELLETLSVSPEKRALLEEHLRLKDVLALGRKPFAVPIETERSLAQRIPILGKYDDDLASVWGRFAGVRAWIGARAFGLATATALLLLAAIGWYALHGNTENIIPERTAPSQVSSSVRSEGLNSMPQEMPHRSISDISNPGPAHKIFRSRIVAKSLAGSEGNSPAIAASQNSGPKSAEIETLNPIVSPEPHAMAIPDGHVAHTMSELLLPQLRDLSPVSVGGSFIINQSYLPTLSNGPSHSLMMMTGDATVDYDFSPVFSVGLDFGDAVGSSLTNSANYVGTPSSDYTRLFENPIISNQILYDLLATMHVTLFPESEYHIRVGTGGGDAFGAGPIAEATAGISRVLAPNLTLDLTAVATRVWTNGNSTILNPIASSEVVGIVGRQVSTKSMYTTAFGVSAGLRFRLPE